MSRLDCALADITHAHQYLSELWRIPCSSIGRYLADALLNVMYILCILYVDYQREDAMSVVCQFLLAQKYTLIKQLDKK